MGCRKSMAKPRYKQQEEKICHQVQGGTTKKSRYHTKNDPNKYPITPTFVMARISIVVINNIHFGDIKANVKFRWR